MTHDTDAEPPRLKPQRDFGMPSACRTGGCAGPARPPAPPPPSYGEVRVNGVEIAPEAIAQEIQHHPAPDADTAWREAARALVIRELLLHEARRLGIDGEAETGETGVIETEDDAIIGALLDAELEAAGADEAECRRFYESRRAQFRTPDLFEASHILMAPEGDDAAAWAAAREQADAIIARIGDSQPAFAEAARSLSACPTANQDGSLGQVRRGELVAAVQKAIEAIPEGETRRGPVRSPHGWHVLRLHRRIPGHELPFEAVRPKIADMLEARSWSVAATRYVADLAARSRIEGVTIDPDAVAAASAP